MVPEPGGAGAALEHGEFLGVPLLDHAEAAELAFEAVEVAVVVGVRVVKRLRLTRSMVSTRSTTCTGNGSRVTQGCPAAWSAR